MEFDAWGEKNESPVDFEIEDAGEGEEEAEDELITGGINDLVGVLEVQETEDETSGGRGGERCGGLEVEDTEGELEEVEAIRLGEAEVEIVEEMESSGRLVCDAVEIRMITPTLKSHVKVCLVEVEEVEVEVEWEWVRISHSQSDCPTQLARRRLGEDIEVVVVRWC